MSQGFAPSELAFRRLLETAPDGMVIVDRSGRIVFANEKIEEMFGYPQAELLGQSIELLVPDRYRHAHVLQREGYVAQPRSRPMAAGLPLSGVRKDGTEIPVEIALAPLETEAGLLTTAIVRDVSERRKLDLLKEQFLSILSHELRTPINAIMGFASILEDEVVGPVTRDQHRYLQRILHGADVLLTLIDDLLDMSRIQAGKFSLTPIPMRFQPLVQEVCEVLRPLAEQKRHTLTYEVQDDLPELVADPQRVRQVLTNLVNNAIKFTPEGGAVKVRALVARNMLRCEVEDTGLGIAQEDLSRLFIPFSQLDMSRTRPAGGTGLGLAISKSLVDAHGGRMGVESVHGKGSIFWFELPLLPGDGAST